MLGGGSRYWNPILMLFTIMIMIGSSTISIADFSTSNVIYVDDEGHYNSIQEALDAAEKGDTIFVKNGTYFENIIIDKEIILRGDGEHQTFIDGNGENVIHIGSDNIEISGFTIKNGLRGIYIENSSDCIINDNTISENEVGIYSDNLSYDNLIYLNNFFKNNYSAYDYGDDRWYKSKQGNYWDDFNKIYEEAFDNNSDGIIDNQYIIKPGFNIDLYPLLNPLTDKPVTDFYYQPVNPTAYEKIKFNDTSFDPDGYIVSWFWNFSNGITSNIRNATVEYENDGVYNVTLEVTDNYGVRNSTVKQIFIENSKPIVKFDYSPFNPDDVHDTTFFDESYDKDGGIIKWEWNFGDGTIIIGSNDTREISHKYEDNGTYNVTLTVFDNDLSYNSSSISISVFNVKPIVDFSYHPINSSQLLPIEDREIKFYDNSKDLDGEIINYSWDFGDDSISNTSSPTHIYKNGGTYFVSLLVYDNDNGYNSKQVRITVLSEYESHYSNFPTGLSLIGILLIVFILILVFIAIRLGKKS